jgi:hypothetical protein
MLDTRSVFYFGHTVGAQSNTIRIDEGQGAIDVEIPSGRYSLSEYIEVVSSSINNNLDLDFSYVVSVDRISRVVTISADQIFSLLVSEIFPLNSAFPIMGFNELVDLTGLSNYSGDTASGSIYLPQFKIDSYIDSEQWKEYIDGSVKETASGLEEVISFGLKKYFSINIKFITDIKMSLGAPIENNQTGVRDAISFLDYLITKGDFEFMPDRDDRNTFFSVRLQSTPNSKNGISYKLREPFQNYYETGKLKLRKL